MEHPLKFNPLDKRHLGQSIVKAILGTKPYNLNELESFDGAGLYLLYYLGDFELYRKLSIIENGFSLPAKPIYIGKAEPPGKRKGLSAKPEDAGPVLYRRLKEHLSSIQTSTNLSEFDFKFQVIVVDDIWIPLAESLLIQYYKPLWNTVLDGFGNHDPGKGRHAGARPDWDEIHPGRQWALKCSPPKRTYDEIVKRISGHLANTH